MKLIAAVRTHRGFRFTMHLDDSKVLPGRVKPEARQVIFDLLKVWDYLGDPEAAVTQLRQQLASGVTTASLTPPHPDPEWVYTQEYPAHVDPRDARVEFERLCAAELDRRQRVGEPLEL